MNSFKSWYTDRKGKYILFFGFYLLLFIFLAFYLRAANNLRNEQLKEEEQEQEIVITTYDISYLINSNYKYTIEIVDNDEIINFNGTKNNIDYGNFENKYFLDIYNINQLLKKSKLVDSENYILTYELNNKELNEILLTNKSDGVNTIKVYVNNKTEVEKIIFNLASYLEKDKYEITINYGVGENNENSSS